MDYTPDSETLAAWQSYCREELEGVPIHKRLLPLTTRRTLLERHGEAAVAALIGHCLPNAIVRNMNDQRRNHPGYDLLIDERIRVQVKGRCWVELLDFAASPFSDAASWESDLWVAVDFGSLIDGRWGRLAGNSEVAPRKQIDFWIAPTEQLKQIVANRYGAGYLKRVRLWFGKTEKQRRSKYHCPELHSYKNALHFITRTGLDTASKVSA